ncbi:MAG: hypothetical protein LC777_08220 [Actinobacteria bacterium]|nr:hypothetical protein [Actinomycetota bacterium]
MFPGTPLCTRLPSCAQHIEGFRGVSVVPGLGANERRFGAVEVAARLQESAEAKGLLARFRPRRL